MGPPPPGTPPQASEWGSQFGRGDGHCGTLGIYVPCARMLATFLLRSSYIICNQSAGLINIPSVIISIRLLLVCSVKDFIICRCFGKMEKREDSEKIGKGFILYFVFSLPPLPPSTPPPHHHQADNLRQRTVVLQNRFFL
jgi:hypothetical protein